MWRVELTKAPRRPLPRRWLVAWRISPALSECAPIRDDENFAHVAAWEWTGDPMASTRHREELEYETVHFQTRSYK